MSGGHCLQPFPGGWPPQVRLEAVIRRKRGVLLLCYLLRGELAGLVIPERSGPPERRDGLWRETCFELFIAPQEGRGYWELNLSPAGHWNLYAFDDYRTGMRPVPASRPCFKVARADGSLALVLELSLEGLTPPGARLAAGPAAVLAAGPGNLSYWALHHPETGADFHRREFFTVSI